MRLSRKPLRGRFLRRGFEFDPSARVAYREHAHADARRTPAAVPRTIATGAWIALSLGCLLASGCAQQADTVIHRTTAHSPAQSGRFARELASARTVGPGPRFRPPAVGFRAAHGAVIDGMLCESRPRLAAAAHVELFADNHVVLVPAGIGLAPPLRVRGAALRGGRCAYPLRTLDPTGLVLLGPGGPRTLGELFAVWGQPLGPTAVAGFRAGAQHRLSVFVGGARWHGDPRAAPLRPGSQVTIEVGAHVPPHTRYTFPSLAWARS